MANVSDIFGQDFASKLSSAKRPWTEISEEEIPAIVEQIKKLSPDSAATFYFKKYKNEEKRMEILLVTSLKDGTVKIRPTKNPSFVFVTGIKWLDKFVSLFMSIDDSMKIQPETTYVIVGNLQTKPYNGSESYSMFVKKIFTLEDIQKYMKV